MDASRARAVALGASVRFARAGAFVVMVACLPRDPLPDDAVEVTWAPPTIAGWAVGCVAAQGAWRFEVRTDAWAGGASLLWTVDGAYIERHGVFRSVEAAPDGSADRWVADLSIADDFRPAGSGGVTAFTCRAGPSLLLWVDALDGADADCVRWGPTTEPLLALENHPPCRRFLAPDGAEDGG